MRRRPAAVLLGPFGALSAMALLAACSGPGAPRTNGASAKPSPSPAGAIDGTTPLPDPPPDIAARVNGQAIPYAFVSVLAEQILKTKDRYRDRPYAFRLALRQLVDRELLVEEALARGLSADDARVAQMYNESHLQVPDEDKWATYLANEGLTRDALRAQIRAQLTAQALIEREVRSVPTEVSDDEARAFYGSNPSLFETPEKVEVSEILLRKPAELSAVREATVRREAESLLARVKKGEDFAALARRYSQDADSARKGGEIPPFSRGQAEPSFEKAAFGLSPGEVSGIVETSQGLHILKMRKRISAEPQPFERVRDRVMRDVVAARRQERIQKLVDGLRAKAKIETFL